jgi:hypothetical protein
MASLQISEIKMNKSEDETRHAAIGELEAWDGDSKESRTAFRAYDSIAEPVSCKTSWQIWRDACAWQASRAALTAEKVAAEPVAYDMTYTNGNRGLVYPKELAHIEKARIVTGYVAAPLYAAAQPAQTQVALTQERIRKIAEEHVWGGKCTTADDLEKAIVAALCEASLAAHPVSGGKS